MSSQITDVREQMLMQCRGDIKRTQKMLAFHLNADENPEAARQLRTLSNLKNELEMLETLSIKDLEGVL